ncbi:MAG: hypothetical protein JWQ19_917 [Subtercola sp.]|nr:hypothetical protein [Subtercola sp.]
MGSSNGWEGIATLIQAVGTIVALAGLAATVLFTRRGQRLDLQRVTEEAQRAERSNAAAEAAAERSERAASLTIDTLGRIADAVESIALKPANGSTLYAEAAPLGVKWSLNHFQGDTYILTNVGGVIAIQVDVSADESMIGPQNVTGGPDLAPDEAITFMAARTFTTADSTITVTWTTNADGDRDVWRYPLPARPPR